MEQPTGGQNVTPHVAQPGTEPPKAGAPVAPAQPTWSQLDGYAERARVALPAAPPGLLDGYMRFAPWVAIVLGALGVFFSLIGLVFGAALGGALLIFGGAEGAAYSGALLIALAVGLLINVVEIVGGYLMLQRKATGWWLLAIGMVISLLNSLFGRSVLVFIVVLLIAYVHLQVKPNYRET
jgi:hypothetical protein